MSIGSTVNALNDQTVNDSHDATVKRRKLVNVHERQPRISRIFAPFRVCSAPQGSVDEYDTCFADTNFFRL